MAIPLFEDDLAIISKLSDNPNAGDGLSAEELKAKFDAAPLAIQDYINNILIPNLDKTIDVDALVADLLDATLTLKGKAAEAKATGEAIAAVKETAEKALKTAEGIEPGASDEEIAQIQKNADAIAALPITVREDGFTEITGLPQGASVHTVVDGNKYTMTLTLNDGTTSVNEITVEDGYPAKIVTDGVEMPLTWEIVKAALTAMDLFKGEDNTEVTGGWASTLFGAAESDAQPEMDIADGVMVVYMTCANPLSGDGGFVTKNAIDLTGISKITVKFDASISNGAALTAGIRLGCVASADSWDDSYSQTLISAIDHAVSLTDQTVSLDVSGLSEARYIALRETCGQAYPGGVNMTLTVKELVME